MELQFQEGKELYIFLTVKTFLHKFYKMNDGTHKIAMVFYPIALS
jgi:hypothetical protein